MAIDKKITDLALTPVVNGNDVSVLVRDNVDYQFTLSALLQYLNSNLSTGASISFGTALPPNNQGKNGDVFINKTDNSFSQKANDVWVTRYQIINNGNNTILYSLGIPPNNTGYDGDTYINTATGVFYKKTNGTWLQVFSMQTGPAGPAGFKGDPGVSGVDGKSILNGTGNPSNLTTGTDGDFYINTLTSTLFGPKENGAWGVGTPLTSQGWFEVYSTDPGISTDIYGRLSYQNDFLKGRANYLIEARQSGKKFSTADNADIHYDPISGSFTILVPGFVLDPQYTLIIWVSNYIIPPSSGGGTPVGGEVLTITDLTVTTDGQTQFNISSFPTTKSWLNINGAEYHFPEDYTIGTVNSNITLSWLNAFPLSITDKLKLFKY